MRHCPFLNSLVQGILCWAESLSVRLGPQFIPGSLNVLSDSLSPSPAAPYRVVPTSGGFSIYKSSVAGPNRLVCNIRKSPMLDLFLSLPGSVGSGHGRLPSTLGRSSGLRVSSLVHHSQSSGEAPEISGDGAHLGGSVLASASLVSRPPSPVAGPSGGSASSSRPPAPASVSQPLPGSPQAVSSCLETLRGSLPLQPPRLPCCDAHPRARLINSSGRFTGLSATLTVTRSLNLPCLRWLTFFAAFDLRRALLFLPSEATAPCYLRCSVFIFRRCLLIQ